MGARMVVFGTYVNKDGQKQFAWYAIPTYCGRNELNKRSYDFNDHFGEGRKAFKSCMPDWAAGNTYQLFEEYAAEHLTGSDSDEPNTVKIAKPGLKLPTGPNGIPLLPRHCLRPKHRKDAKDFLKFQKDVLRAFVNAAYSKYLIIINS